ncbi:MAG TPA: response regulator [Anaerolineales bacterium]|jgi:CheY-like chemotaxis protein
MPPTILLVDDQRDILRLLHATLDTLGHELEIVECPSGEEALLEASRRHVDLLVADYLLPGINGIQLMSKIRARHPNIKVILITGMSSDRKARNELLNAGAMALFDKPIPLADFMDAVERGLGLVRTIFPPETADKDAPNQNRLPDLLANFRQDIKAEALFLLSGRGRVLARAGGLYDSSLEVSLLSALMAIYSAGMKVSKFIRQEASQQYHVFKGGDQDLLLIPVNSSYALLLAGNDLVTPERLAQSVAGMQALGAEIEKTLKSMGVTPEPLTQEASPAAEAPASKKKKKTSELSGAPAEPPSAEMEALLKDGPKKKIKSTEMDTFWDEAAEKHANVPTNPDVISYEQARQLGLAPGEQEK